MTTLRSPQYGLFALNMASLPFQVSKSQVAELVAGALADLEVAKNKVSQSGARLRSMQALGEAARMIQAVFAPQQHC